MTRASSSSRNHARRPAIAAALLVAYGGCHRDGPPAKPVAAIDRDTRPYTPWQRRDDPLPFPKQEWYWQDLLAVAPAPEPLPSDAEAATRLNAAFERVATLDPIQSEDELPTMVADARKDPQALFAVLDDARPEVRFAAARVMFRLMASADRCVPQRLVAAAASHLRDRSDEVALLHLETVSCSGFEWTQPILLKIFGKVDNHLVTVVRVRAAAKLAKMGCYGGIPLLIKVLKEQTTIQDDVNREWDVSMQTAWWKEEAIDGIAAAAGGERFGHSPDASDADQVACVHRIETWWSEHRERLWAAAGPIKDPVLLDRVHLLILGFGTFQIRNVDNAGFILAGLGPKVLPALFEALRGSNFMIRRHVLGVLSQLVTDVSAAERDAFVNAVKSGLADPDPAIRVRSLEVIGNSRLPQAVGYLESALSRGDAELAETALHVLSTWRTPQARTMLERFENSIPPEHALRVPVQAARLAAGDLNGLQGYLRLLGPERTPDTRAQQYLSWIVENDGLSEAKTSEQRQQALQRIEAEIRRRAK